MDDKEVLNEDKRGDEIKLDIQESRLWRRRIFYRDSPITRKQQIKLDLIINESIKNSVIDITINNQDGNKPVAYLYNILKSLKDKKQKIIRELDNAEREDEIKKTVVLRI